MQPPPEQGGKEKLRIYGSVSPTSIPAEIPGQIIGNPFIST